MKNDLQKMKRLRRVVLQETETHPMLRTPMKKGFKTNDPFNSSSTRSTKLHQAVKRQNKRRRIRWEISI